MIFEWDGAKNRTNIAKPGIDFALACRIFEGFTLDIEDTRFDYGEARIQTLGRIASVAVLMVVHTDRHGTCRIISARKASTQERARYDQAIQKSFDA